ncbi:MAG: site-specific integrase [Thermoproteota archaeon]|nr:site-specific integrase [Thermoproteota archaeon]
MRRIDSINKISSNNVVQSAKSMQVLDEQSKAYFNFINSLDSGRTRQSYEFCIQKFLNHYRIDFETLLKLPQQDISNLLIKYLVEMKISKSYKIQIFSAIRHACEMNDVILNWKKLKKFIKSEKTGNQSSKDRGYTHEEIQKILVFCDQRIRTVFLLLASTGMRIGAMHTLKVEDLEKLDDIYKITVYAGDKEEYFTFCTPECAKEIDAYLEYRKRRGEKITSDSYLIVKKFTVQISFKSKPFNNRSLQTILEYHIKSSGIREVDHINQFKRKPVPILHGFRKFFTTQLVNSKLNPEIREMLLGHKIGLASCYYKPTEQEMLNEYLKAVNLLTINEENRLKLKLEQTIQIEKSQIESLKADFEKFKNEVLKQRK